MNARADAVLRDEAFAAPLLRVVEPAPVHLLDATMFWNLSGGVRRYIGAKRDWLHRHTGWQHSVATPMPDEHGQLRVPSLPLPGSGGAYRLPWRRVAAARLLEGAGPSLIESADPYRLAWAALDAAQRLQIPAVAFCHSNPAQLAAQLAPGAGGRLMSNAASRYLAHLYRQFDLVLAPSHAMLGHLHAWGVHAAVRQPLGVDCGTYHPARADLQWRHALGLPPRARLLVYSGRFAPEKNLQTLADAVARLGPRYWLVTIGAGAAAPRGPRVIVLPAVRESAALAGMLASADLFVHAGDQETFGLAALEAMACGLPVVARKAEGLGELVDASVGAGVEGASASAFADAIAGVFDRDPRALGAAARRRALGRDWERVLPDLWWHYRRLLGARAVRAA